MISLVSEASNLSNKSTLLELSQPTKPTTASELFKSCDKRHSKDEDFFDSLGSSGGHLERPASELCLAQHQDGAVNPDVLQHSSSQNDLVTLQNQQQHNNTHKLHSQMYPAHLAQNTESMQSITLSRDSLSSEPQNVSIDLGVQNSAPISETVDPLASTSQQQQFNQPQQQQAQQYQPQQQQPQQYQQQLQQVKYQQPPPQQQHIEFNIDHMKSFDNPALAVEEESLNAHPLQSHVFPEQPATVQNTLLNQTVSFPNCQFVYKIKLHAKLSQFNFYYHT